MRAGAGPSRHLRRGRHPSQRCGRSRTEDDWAAISTSSSGRESSPSARPAWTDTGTGPRSRMQQEWFDRHLELAHELDLPVVIHCRDCQRDIIEQLQAPGPSGPRSPCTRSPAPGTTPRRSSTWACTYRSPGMLTFTNKSLDALRDVAARVPARPHPRRDRQPLSEPPSLPRPDQRAGAGRLDRRAAGRDPGPLPRRVRADHHRQCAAAVPPPRRRHAQALIHAPGEAVRSASDWWDRTGGGSRLRQRTGRIGCRRQLLPAIGQVGPGPVRSDRTPGSDSFSGAVNQTRFVGFHSA